MQPCTGTVNSPRPCSIVPSASVVAHPPPLDPQNPACSNRVRDEKHTTTQPQPLLTPLLPVYFQLELPSPSPPPIQSRVFLLVFGLKELNSLPPSHQDLGSPLLPLPLFLPIRICVLEEHYVHHPPSVRIEFLFSPSGSPFFSATTLSLENLLPCPDRCPPARHSPLSPCPRLKNREACPSCFPRHPSSNLID